MSWQTKQTEKRIKAKKQVRKPRDKDGAVRAKKLEKHVNKELMSDSDT